jgi:hypothetical protein
MMKWIFAAAASLFLASVGICSTNDLSHFNHFSSGTFTASVPSYPHHFSGNAIVQGVYHHSGELKLTITADTPPALVATGKFPGEWICEIVFNQHSGRFDLKNSFPFHNGHVATSAPYNLHDGVLLSNELIGVHAGDSLRGTLRIHRGHGSYTLALHLNAGAKRYTFEYRGS